MLSRRAADAFVVLLTGWLLWPQHAAGYGLAHDLVFTPDQPLNAGSVGLGSTPPRAVPLDALVALAGKLLGGQLTGRIALAVPLLLAGWGSIRLLQHCAGRSRAAGWRRRGTWRSRKGVAFRASSVEPMTRKAHPPLAEASSGAVPIGGAVMASDAVPVGGAGPVGLPALLLAGGLAVWNPYVIERLALGQWALLWCYGALPWLIRAADRVRARPADTEPVGPSPWPGLICALAACAITPTGGLIGAAAALTVGWSGLRSLRTAGLAGLALLLQLPWLLPALTSTASVTSDPRAVAAFAARPEHPGGTLTSLFGLGGSWNADVMPASRAGLLGYLTAAMVLVALAVGVRLIGPRLLAIRLTWLGIASVVLAVAATVPGLASVVRWAVRTLPGAGLLRDGQKWLMPFVLLAVLAGALAVQRLDGWLAGRHSARAPVQHSAPVQPSAPVQHSAPVRLLLPVVAAALPLMLLPDAPATLRLPLTPVHYPAGWHQVAERVAGSPTKVLALPFASYRAFDWAPGRTVIDPAPRLLDAPTVVDDRLAVGGTVLAGEDPAAAQVGALLGNRPGPAEFAGGLARLGVGWVVVETDTAGPALPDLTGLQPVLAGQGVRLYRVPGEVRRESSDQIREIVVVGVDLLVGLLVLAAAGVSIGRARVNAGRGPRSLLHSPVTHPFE